MLVRELSLVQHDHNAQRRSGWMNITRFRDTGASTGSFRKQNEKLFIPRSEAVISASDSEIRESKNISKNQLGPRAVVPACGAVVSNCYPPLLLVSSRNLI